MNEKKGLGFAVNTFIKLAVYLLICMGIYLLSGLIEGTARHFVPAAAAIGVTWLFLKFMEGGRRSFFAKGYMLENIIQGSVAGIIAAALPMVFEALVNKRLVFDGFVSGVDFRLPLYEVFRVSLFAGVVFFGYIFHILQHDAGNVLAVVISTALYTLFGLFSVSIDGGGLDVTFNSGAGLVCILTLAASGIAAGLCIVNFGDMRSGTAFICLKNLTEIMAVTMMDLRYRGTAAVSGDFMYGSPACTVTLAVICVWLFVSAVKKR
ncbi:MAG: hypothetical protein NC078_01305 [Ruminococcus sp.]|nr:hypothetical protein [Ruminococcus sp.]